MIKKSLIIGIDATCIPSNIVGGSSYIVNLIKTLAQFDNNNIYLIFAKKKNILMWQSFVSKSNFKFIPCNLLGRGPRIFWELVILPFQLKQFNVDIFHAPHYFLPLLKGSWRSVVTIHDMSFFILPSAYNLPRRWFLQRVILLSLRKADKIIAVSESTKKDIVNICNVPVDTIKVIHEARSEHFKPIKDQTILKEIKYRYNTSDNFILFVGELQPRKNIVNLIRAYFLARQKSSLEYKLIIVGQKTWKVRDIFSTVKDLGLEEKVIFTGYVPQEDLPLLYNAASLFVYPSLCEGFGLTILEAMACGVPVITSNIFSMPEVTGDAAKLVDPYSVEEIASVIYEILSDEALRESMIQKGFERIKEFSWERAARETLAVYEEISKI